MDLGQGDVVTSPHITGNQNSYPSVQQTRASLQVARTLSLAAACLSCATLVGWFLHWPLLTSMFPHYATMKPNTALCLGLLGVASLLMTVAVNRITVWHRWVAGVFQGTAFLISSLTVLEYGLHRSLGLDQWLFLVPSDGFSSNAGRMSAGTAIALTVTSAAYLLLDRLPTASVWLLIGGLLLSISGLAGFVFSAGPLLLVLWLKSLAVPTAAALFLLQVAGLVSRPDREPYRSLVLSQHREGNRHYLLFAITLGPFLSALPVVWGLRHGFYDAFFSLALLLVLLLCVQSAVMWADNRILERAGNQLRASEHRASLILESIGDAVIVTDAWAKVDRMNSVAEDLTGWSTDEASGRDLNEVFRIVNEETREIVEDPVDKVRRLGAVVGLANHTVLLSRSGRQTHIDDSSAPIWGEGGELAGVVLVFRNIDERRQTERLLRASDEKLKIALETVQLGSWELDLTEGRLICSNGCKAHYGRLPQEPLSYSDLIQSIHPDDRAMMQQAVQKALQTQAVYKAEYRVTWPDGSPHWIVASGRVLLDQDRAPQSLVGMTLDVTERHQAAAALLQSEKLAVVGRLASSIAHEINNPLESVTNLLFLMHDSSDLSEIRSYIKTAERELRRASGITNQTLRFHKQSLRPTANSFEDLLEVVLSIYQGKLLNSKVTVEVRSRTTTPIRCFEGEIRQVLSNLIGNATDAMQPPGGTLQIRCRNSQRRDGSEGILITLADTGTGIPREAVKNIFEPFFTTKGDLGTGLGLWVSQQIVQRHGGYLRVRSSQQASHRGTVFTMFLPFDAIERT